MERHMIAIILLVVGVLVGVTIISNQTNPQPLPSNPPPTTQDCGCGVPESPRGPR
jgi:hypothetical protein